MCWQQAILKRYRETYPKESMRSTAKKLGVHYSRLSRIINGSEMKVSEYESFNKLIAHKSITNDYSIRLFNEAMSKLPKKRIKEITILIERSLINYQIVHKPIIEKFNLIS